MNNYIPNTTQVPNIIFDFIMKYLSGSELKVLLFFIRQRYGFQKFEGQFSYSIKQICEGIKKHDGSIICNGTGLSNRAVLTAIDTLHNKYKLINKKSGNWKDNECNKYKLTIDSFNEKNSSTKLISEKSSPTLGEKSSLEVSEKSSPTLGEKSSLSRNKKKPIKTKKKPISNIDYSSYTHFNNDMFVNIWNEWLQYNKEKKNTMPPTTINYQLKKLHKFSVEIAIQMIEKSIESNWQGIFPLKENNYKKMEEASKKAWEQITEEAGNVK